MSPSPPASINQQSECILIVDDEPLILKLVQSFLESAGYRVLTATDGIEALAVFKQRNSEIDPAPLGERSTSGNTGWKSSGRPPPNE